MKKITVEEVRVTETEQVVDPPPPNLKQTFKNLPEWLTSICEWERPRKPISIYAIGLFESNEGRALFLVGMSNIDNHEKIEFQPKDMYFLLPRGEYKVLGAGELNSKLVSELTDFTKTKTFLDSYLAQADSILFRGKTVIWSKAH